MALFPFFMNIEGKAGLIIGSGKHAQEKIERLAPYGPELTVIEEKNFKESDLDSLPAFVIVAGEDKNQNHRIAELCRAKRILVNVVDDQEYCDFIFPSLISHGNLSVGICTNGASPATGVLLKRKIESQIPENIEEILDFLQKKRPAIAQALNNKKQRFAFYYQLSEICMANDRALSEEEFTELLKSAINENP
ncbi:MAG: bifunctional precorrin-2 dehydrogenase/sirohydrochlorin ferrochelatase [Lachnospiraceae bacterium]|nr:bifunctional precorrin-2 dehydrogenase/sirohydrochlorin ferrochelatase [Lachnospiraceae bacterium]